MTAPTPAWDEFAAALRTELSRLGDGMTVVIVWKERSWLSAQFAQGRQSLWAEVSGQRLGDAEYTRADTPEDRRILGSHGWLPPDPAETFWWHRTVAYPPTSAEYREIVAGVVAALRDVNGVPGPEHLGYRAWEALEGNRYRTLDLPGVEALPLRAPGAPA
ncbi:hypothetical protein Dvina_06310 [Dactylosporangium vinaceum]|uniref:TY-Chap N-terminal domain-containing protein n=1 Tax=Dactylosporangium vinaceum TaxID=53362 RepID=A0ABV5M646_9ACTN|nr:hypothetical protein [Dactylosporangium vinaceum]UAB97734.1 hypothetical protein Dvina_06310 [Dactylosporangium vinaceum]